MIPQFPVRIGTVLAQSVIFCVSGEELSSLNDREERGKWYTLVDDFRTFSIGQMVSEIPLLNQVCLG